MSTPKNKRVFEAMAKQNGTDAKAGTPRPPLLRHVRDLLTNPPAVRWLIRGIIEADTLALLYGQPGAGKSFLALSMAASIACGADWYDHRVTQGPAVYILGEGGGGVSRRLRAWQLSNPYAHLEAAPLFISRRMVPLGEAEAVEEIAAAIEESGAGKPSSVWIDTLARAAAGLDENSSRDMGELIKACDAIRARYGCAVILVHHSGHNQERARGSSAIKAALDTELSATKDGPVITLQSTKSKEGEPFKPLTFQLAGVDTGWNDEDGERVYSAVLEECDAPEQAEQLGKNQGMAVAVLRGLFRQRVKTASEGGRNPESVRIGVSDWKEATLLNRNRFAEVKKSLIEKGLITISGNFVALLEASEPSESVRNGRNRTPDTPPSETSESPLGLGTDGRTGRTESGQDDEVATRWNAWGDVRGILNARPGVASPETIAKLAQEQSERDDNALMDGEV
ncbi:MAG: AAA family ATPase [Acidithiobacillus ferrooxidans]|nr:AAA family ATPase [Acidithiobacillus ferrooxidans]MDD5003133.1 AAA family ATPase [Acidithiobacillus sp.]MDD5379505.1 AAA family ATPase [Acidithiobacillus sp.]MDD5576463.1 AAA family ATPase [Acidithiobacillus sp.]